MPGTAGGLHGVWEEGTVSVGTQTDEGGMRMGLAGACGGGPCMPASWRKGEAIGAGSQGTVFLGLNNETGELLAVKEVTMVEGPKNKDAVEQLEQEVALLSSLNHPNIVRYVGTLRENSSLFIFLEYVPGGSIASLISRFGPLEETLIRIYTRQILLGLAYLHAQRTVHRDIKGANLLVEKNGRIKLADFGMAKQMVEQVSFTKSFKGSAFWMAPEVIKQQGHGVAADIWSVGCTVLEMATGRPPWQQCATQVQVIFRIASSQDLPAIPDSLSPMASEFVLLCLQRNPAQRPSVTELLQHPFVAPPAGRLIPALASDPEYERQMGRHMGERSGLGSVGGAGAGPNGTGPAGPSGLPPRSGAAGRTVTIAPGGAASGALDDLLEGLTAKGGEDGGGGGGLAADGGLGGAADDLASLVLGNAALPMSKRRSSHALQALGSGAAQGSGQQGPQDPGQQGTGQQGPQGQQGSGGQQGPGAQQQGAGEVLDFSTQPQLFKVRGVLSLPPLRMLQGQDLPPLRITPLKPPS